MKKNKEKFFYQMNIDESIEKLKSDLINGLSEKEANIRIKKYGLNKLNEGKKKPVIFRFFDQFKDLMIIMLICAALLSYYLNDFRGGTILLMIVFINALVGFYQEFKAEKILESLKSIISSNATVIRDGKKKEIPQSQITVGDLVYLEEGSLIPADIRLVKTNNFSTNDFILTGESVAQEKFADLVIKEKTGITNQDNLVFLGISVAKGSAYGIVYGIGMDTAIGRIAKVSSNIKRDNSPLQKEMNSLAKILTKIAGIIALSLFFINFLLNFSGADNLKDTIELSILFAIGVAAASVPQGLPAQVSVALSLGVGRMAKRKAIVRKLSAVETLGATTIICSDKTGTLTKNEMTIKNCYVNNKFFDVSGDGYLPKGFISYDGSKLDKKALEKIKQFLEDGFLASNGRVNAPDKNHKDYYAIGDPTEAAFTPLIIKGKLNPDTLNKNFKLVHELGFDSDRKRMVMIRKHKGKLIAYMKGGLESVLSVSKYININGKIRKITEKDKKEILKNGECFAENALRVIALAYKDYEKKSFKKDEINIKNIEKDFIFSGFVGMMDPPRNAVKFAIKSAYNAHIQIMMITGDNAITAKAIAKKVGMKNFNKKDLDVYTGDEIKKLSDNKLKEILKNQSVIFSRVSPEDKYRIVKILKKSGNVVAVTGDGVNDTLSLKKSDIGVAMGKMGSEVAKEAAEIVLLDDNFKTLISAIREGRTIFKNLKKTIIASITSNIGELVCVLLGFIGAVFGLPIPITAVQILAVDLIGEMLPLTALTFDKAEDSILKEKPRNLKQHIINKKSLTNIVFYGFWMGLSGFFSFYMLYHVHGTSIESARAATYCAIILSQYINILSRRTESSIFTKYLFSNKQLWISLGISILTVMILIYSPMAIWLGFKSIKIQYWIYPTMSAVFFLILHEGRKLIHTIRASN